MCHSVCVTDYAVYGGITVTVCVCVIDSVSASLTVTVSTLKTLPHVTISPTISLTMPTSTMEINEIVDDGPATRNDMVNDAGVT